MQHYHPPKRAHYILIVTLFCFLGAAGALALINSFVLAESNPPAFISIASDEGSEYLEVLHTGKMHGANKDSVDQLIRLHEIAKPPVVQMKQTVYNRNPSFLVWTILIIIMFGVATGSIPIYLKHVWEKRKKFGLGYLSLGGSLFFALLLCAMAFLFTSDAELLYQPSIIVDDLQILFKGGDILEWISILIIGLEIPIFMNFFLIGPCADRIRLSSIDKKSVEEAFLHFQHLKNSLTRGLQVITVLVVLSVLTSTALGESIRTEISLGDGLQIFPKEASYMYGLAFSCFLALIYVPAYFYLDYKEQLLLAHIQTQPFVENEDAKTWMESLQSKLLSKHSPMETVKLVLTLMAPLISSFLPGFHFM